MNSATAKKIFKVAVFLYVASFLVLNWNDISWVFNYRTVSGLVSDFFNPYPSIDASSMSAYFYPNNSNARAMESLPAKEVPFSFTEKQSAIEIPKIAVTAPIIFSASANTSSIMKDLNSGVVYYPGSVYPEQQGQIIILGHSAPVGWPKVRYDWVFSDLEKLEIGDIILIDLNNKQYTYIVKQKNIIKRGADVPAPDGIENSNTLTLISCWPPGKDYQRIAVQAELQTD